MFSLEWSNVFIAWGPEGEMLCSLLEPACTSYGWTVWSIPSSWSGSAIQYSRHTVAIQYSRHTVAIQGRYIPDLYYLPYVAGWKSYITCRIRTSERVSWVGSVLNRWYTTCRNGRLGSLDDLYDLYDLYDRVFSNLSVRLLSECTVGAAIWSVLLVLLVVLQVFVNGYRNHFEGINILSEETEPEKAATKLDNPTLPDGLQVLQHYK